MLDYVYGHDEAVAHFVAQLIPECRELGFGNCKAIGVIDDRGHMIAGLVYNHYNPQAKTIEISAAALPGKYWMTRRTLGHMFGYPFRQIGCQMVFQRIKADDVYQMDQMERFNYMFVTVPRMFGRDTDGVLCLLTYEDWINNKFNKRKSAAPILKASEAA